MCFPSFCFFCFCFSYTSALLCFPSITTYQQASSLTRLKLWPSSKTGIDPTVNLISAILCRAFSFTALHSAKQTWLFRGVVYHFRERNSYSTQRKLRDKTHSQNKKDMLKNVLMLCLNLTGLRFQCSTGTDI